MKAARLLAVVGLVSLASFAFAGLGCGGAGNTGDKMRPKDPSAKDALKEPGHTIQACKPAAGEPLVVDLRSSDRSDFEVAMQDGVAVVSYNCQSLHLLKGCTVHGAAYVFRGVSRKEDIVQMESKDEVEANIPISGARLSAELKAGSTLELALITVGKKSVATRGVHTEDLEGDCDGATHVIRGAYVGAFAMGTGTAGQASAVADMFGVGAGASSVSKRKATAKDGDLVACRKAEMGASSAPQECQAIIRLDLAPLRPRGGPNPNKNHPGDPGIDVGPAPPADSLGEEPSSASASASSPSKSSGKKPGKTVKTSKSTPSAPPPPSPAPASASASKAAEEDEASEVKTCAPGLVWTGVMCKKAK